MTNTLKNAASAATTTKTTCTRRRFGTVIQTQAPAIVPRFMGYKQAAIYSGLGERVLQLYVAAGHIRASHCRAPGNSRGRTLLDRASIDEFIERGIGAPPTELAMNANRKGSLS